MRDACDYALVKFTWRGQVERDELHALFVDAWGEPVSEPDMPRRLAAHSLGWVTARDDDGRLTGFVNVAWDGGAHAFLLDTTVAVRAQRQGVATDLVRRAMDGAREAGCEWMEVDFEPHLSQFYLERCGFQTTAAGLLKL